MKDAASSDQHEFDYPVVIAGAGPVGLMLSILLSRQGIRNIVFEKREQINTMPRARGINVRSVEILTQLDLGEELRRGSLPPTWARQFVYTETMAGELIGIMPGNMGPGMAADHSACEYRIAAQDRLDPMLYAKAESFEECTILFSHEVVDYVDNGSSVTVTIVDRSSPQETAPYELRAQYLIAADGGKSGLRAAAEIGDAYNATYRSFVAARFHGGLSTYSTGREGALIWTLAPSAAGVFHPLDGADNWSVQIQYDPNSENPDEWTPDDVLQKIRRMVGVPDGDELNIELVKYYKYTLTVSVADTFRKGRLLLAGDAAHRTLPHGGWGLNTGIHTAHNLAWKLGAVLRGVAPDALLDTYNNERREAALRNCEFAKVNAGYIEQMMRALRESSSIEERRRIVASSKQYGNWLGLDLGIHYEGTEGPGAYVPDNVSPPSVGNAVVEYTPHAKPGWRAPHFWARTANGGHRVSAVSLFDQDFVLLTGASGQAWIRAASELNKEGEPRILPLRVADDGDLVPEAIDFGDLYGIGSTGAVLVRPDGHVAYRAVAATQDVLKDLRSALRCALGHQSRL
ncbi:FAD-dependent monooxygenase [Paraburkholderia unamae]|uniref:Tetracenomycin A2 monooxygenase-dioxygenase n=1 Tax=Paraburkholderia unamae TaxID=219649 RepID=A0ABX5KVE5_9BURK|nr:FAD-dependent monooxygenase [Paraburkholderia unamae]PVX85853.1 tetracenomycin A2 monooxygenase-dioxygenase [Paraburkholderia unamae]